MKNCDHNNRHGRFVVLFVPNGPDTPDGRWFKYCHLACLRHALDEHYREVMEAATKQGEER